MAVRTRRKKAEKKEVGEVPIAESYASGPSAEGPTSIEQVLPAAESAPAKKAGAVSRLLHTLSEKVSRKPKAQKAAGVEDANAGAKEDPVDVPLVDIAKVEDAGFGVPGAQIPDAKVPDLEQAKKKIAERKMVEERIIYTVVDQIIEIVESKSSIPLPEIARILNVPQNTVEELAKILDEHGILQLHYPTNPLAYPILRSVEKHDFKRLGRQD